jgi:hypothetical protein
LKIAPATPDDNDEADRALLILALAELAALRPGWKETLGRLAGRFDGRGMFDDFIRINRHPGPWLLTGGRPRT